ncbi:hypothetical protein K1719_015623 [Acacia pycnantha]|nr:hypothetical protein K1719_015623 [Acacia pycnantha]
MDHPSHSHHQHQQARYAPLPPNHMRHSQFPEDPRFRPHHLPPPPPPPSAPTPLPPPPSLSYRNVRTPPPYNPPHQSQFSFNAPNYAHGPIEEDRSVSASHPHDFTHSQRVSNRMIIENDRPRQSLPDFDYRSTDNRIGGWNPPRVLSDNRSSRPYPPIDFDRELHHQRPLNHKIAPPYPPTDRVRFNSEGNSRGRVDHIDGYEVKTREEFAWGRVDEKYLRRRDFGSNLNASSGDFGIMSSQSTLSRDLDSENGDYVLYGLERDNEISRGTRRDGLGDSKRWVNDRKGSRDPHNSSFELGNNENGGDGIRVTSGKYYGSELGRYNNRGNRESGHEFSRAPKKQIQKKSALLRLQMVKPNHKNREIEQLPYTNYGDDSSSNSFRGKDQFEYSGFGVKAEERERSPVELDISFKSNSLVAKAIVAPSSSAVSDVDITSVSDTDFAPAEKGKNGLASDNDSPDLKPAKPSMAAVNLGGSPCKANLIPSSNKELNLQKKVSDSCSQLCASVATNCHVKNKGAQTPKGIVSHGITNPCSIKTSQRVAPRVSKKKKIVKKVVKKVTLNRNLNVSSSMSSNMSNGTVKADSIGPSSTSESDKTSLNEKITAVDKVSLPDNLMSSPEEGQLLPDNSKEDLPLVSTGSHTSSQDHEADDNPDIGQVDRIERSENISNSSLGAFSIEDEKNDSDCPNVDDFVHGLHSSLSTDKASKAKSPNGITFSDISNKDDVNMQLCQNEVALSPQQYSNVQYLDNQFQVEDDKNSRLSKSGESVINTDVINTCNSANVSPDFLYSDDLIGNAQKNITVSDFGNDGKVDCKTKALPVSDSVILEESPDTCSSIPNYGMFSPSSSAETRISDGQECPRNARVPMHVSDNSPTNSEENIMVLPSVIVKDSGKEASPVDVNASPENCTTEQSPNTNFLVRFAEGDTNMSKKRKVETHLHFSSSDIGGISPDPIHTVSLANVHTTLSLLKDSSVSEVLNPYVQSSDICLPSITGEITVLDGKGKVSETEVYFGNGVSNNVDRASPLSRINEVTTSDMDVNSLQAELSDAIVVATSCAQVPITISDNKTHQEEGALPSMVKPSASLSLAYPESSAKLYIKSSFGGSVESVNANTNIINFECSQLQHPAINCHSLGDLTFPTDQFPMLENEQKENPLPVVPIKNIQKDIQVSGNMEIEKTDMQDIEKCESGEFIKRSLRADLESSDPQTKDDSPLEHQSLAVPADTDAVTTSDCSTVSDMLSPGTMPDMLDSRTSDCQAIQNESIHGDEDNADSRSKVEQDCDLPASTSYSQYTTNKNIKFSPATRHDNLITGKMMPQPLQVDSKVMTQGLNSSCSELNCGKNHLGSAIPSTFQGQSYLNFPKSKTSAYSTQASNVRTWHRTGNNSGSLPGNKPSAGSVPTKRSISGKKGNFQNTSYIRKGNNSIVRKHTSVSASPQSSANQSSLGFNEFQKSTGSEIMVEISNHANLLKTGLTQAPLERQRTPPLPVDTKLPDHMATACEENKSSPLIEPRSNAFRDSEPEPRNFTEPCDAPNSADDALKLEKTVENLTAPSNNVESQVEVHDENVSLNSKRIVYVKRKSNQLVATSNSCELSAATDDNVQMASSDGYYKRSKNQLVRTTFESQINQTVTMPTVNSDGHRARKASCNRRFGKRRSLKVVGRSCKPLRASLVWTLCGASSSKKDNDSLHHQKVLPYLFPWKRATYLRSFIYSPALSSNANSLSAISKKLVLSRKRDTVYTRSTHGFSLRKSKVLGLGGYSLKWSKSIEKSSKKANEEATLAVAAVEKKKREGKDVASISSRAKRERIFRIGQVRYRMDSSGRALQRISDDESLVSASLRSGLHLKSSYIPRRLVIGNDQYVRIGNGHQLIRDPKKRTRLLANEKIRWSLHTARQRLARKQKYCQFFTRFGKCNKDDRKCPYIHDPSKIAVCTKFLNGLCSTPNCKLTHKIIPERMPDCSYFLQGLCTNRKCPYRHVNVNPKASVCEGFLRGYCADGNECRKKHTYVCPTFEATGICIQGTKCKLRHPQKQGKGKKRKRSVDQRNCKRRRYFGSLRIDVSETGTMVVAPRQGEQNKNDLEEELADYISLDVDDEDVEELTEQASEQSTLCDSEPVDIVLDDEDEVIRPVLIMNKDIRAEASPF